MLPIGMISDATDCCCWRRRLHHCHPKEYFKDIDVKTRVAANWRDQLANFRAGRAAVAAAGVAAASAGSSGMVEVAPPLARGSSDAVAVAVGVRPKVPKVFTVKTAEAFLPRAKGCVLYASMLDGRVRVFYAVGASRRTTSAAVEKYGLHEACLWRLRWVWALHTEITGEPSPHEF